MYVNTPGPVIKEVSPGSEMLRALSDREPKQVQPPSTLPLEDAKHVEPPKQVQPPSTLPLEDAQSGPSSTALNLMSRIAAAREGQLADRKVGVASCGSLMMEHDAVKTASKFALKCSRLYRSSPLRAGSFGEEEACWGSDCEQEACWGNEYEEGAPFFLLGNMQRYDISCDENRFFLAAGGRGLKGRLLNKKRPSRNQRPCNQRP